MVCGGFVRVGHGRHGALCQYAAAVAEGRPGTDPRTTSRFCGGEVVASRLSCEGKGHSGRGPVPAGFRRQSCWTISSDPAPRGHASARGVRWIRTWRAPATWSASPLRSGCCGGTSRDGNTHDRPDQQWVRPACNLNGIRNHYSEALRIATIYPGSPEWH
jgi:hypothetical protein